VARTATTTRSGGDYLAERTWSADGVREACRHRSDVAVTLEYKLKEPHTHSYVNTVGRTILLVQEIGEPNCGVAFDHGHALLGYESPAESVALLSKYGALLRHVHINENYRMWDDDLIVGSVRTLECVEFFYWLRRTGCNGWLTVDQFPYREDGRDAVGESAKWMDALESPAERADPDEVAGALAKKDGVAGSRLMRKLLLG
jgi:xylose isomerase